MAIITVSAFDGHSTTTATFTFTVVPELGILFSDYFAYADGPLYVRYGSFTQRHCRNSSGELVPAIEDAAGELVPDLRPPVFTVPEWTRK